LETIDLDGDQDIDILFGTHFKLGQYGLPAQSFALINNSSTGEFKKVSLKEIGIGELTRVRAISSLQVDEDQELEFAVAQEYGPITIFDRKPDGWESLALCIPSAI